VIANRYIISLRENAVALRKRAGGSRAVPEDWLKAVSRPLRAAQVDPTVPNVARVWNYLVGGRDNFEADRQTARQLVAAAPVVAQVAPASRAFLRRAVTYLAAEAGIRQFLDIGPGMPTAGNTHEVAQTVDPSCRVVYVDNDPVVLSHARAGLRSSGEGATSYLDADARDTGAVMAGASVTLDLAQPVGVIMIHILNFFEDAAEVLAQLAAAVPAGSYLAIMQPSRDERLAMAARRWNQLAATPVFLRDHGTVARWLAGLELVDPGIVEVHRWRPDPGDPDYPEGMPLLGAVARKA
jgi:SAM-dependent methyltransferase